MERTRRWITPRTAEPVVRGVSFDIPIQPEYVAILRAVLVDLCDPANWEQINATSATACEAAALAEIMLQSFEAAL